MKQEAESIPLQLTLRPPAKPLFPPLKYLFQAGEGPRLGGNVTGIAPRYPSQSLNDSPDIRPQTSRVA